jgi:hypothetical protein
MSMSETTLHSREASELRKKAVSQAYFWVPWMVIAGLFALKFTL